MLRSVYGDSIDFSKVVLKEGKAGLITTFNPDRPFVVGNTIYVPSGKLDPSTLVHEMMHVWQYQNGGIDYMGNAVAAQLWGPQNPNGGSRGYYYEGDLAAGKPFEKLNAEQQAQLIQDAFRKGVVPPKNPQQQFIINVNGTPVNFTRYVLQAWNMVNAGKGAP
jgi:chitinase